MKKLDVSKKIILFISFLCLIGAVAILIIMPKPERKLPPLPEANYTYEILGGELQKDGLREISKAPVISGTEYAYYEEAGVTLQLKMSDKEELCPSYEEGDAVTFMLNICNVTLSAKDFISYRLEGSFINATTGYNEFLLTSHNIDFTKGEEISFEEVVSDMNMFIKAFAKGKFTMVRNDKDLEEESNLEMLTNFSPENGIYPDWYIDSENFVVIARAPSAMGGLTEYKIPLIEAEEFLNTDCALINMIFTGK